MSSTQRVRCERSGASTAVFVAYYRVSTDKQGLSGLGLEGQRSAVQRYLEHRKGELVAEFTEIESGKSHKNRPQLLAAIAAAKRVGATLVIAKLDRLARNVHFISGLMEAHCDFVACDMPAANKLTLHIMAAMAEHEREMISQRTKAAMAAAKERGTKIGNPNWEAALLKARSRRHPQHAAAQVRSILKHSREQGKSLRAIAAELNALGLKTPSGAAWHASSVSTHLKAA